MRAAADALSCAKNIEFMGQASKVHTNRDGTLKDFCSMPVKFEFEDKGSRIHFERTLHERCDVRPSMSLPKGIRTAQTAFYNELKALYPGCLVMTRPDVDSLSFIALVENDGDRCWTQVSNTKLIDPSCLREQDAVTNFVPLVDQNTMESSNLEQEEY